MSLNTGSKKKGALQPAGRTRVVIDRVMPQIDGGRFAVKRVVGDTFVVDADIVADGHDLLTAVLRFRTPNSRKMHEIEMIPEGNDRYRGSFVVDSVGSWAYTIEAWIDHFGTWRSGLQKKHDAGVATEMDLRIGAELIAAAGSRAKGKAAARLAEIADELTDDTVDSDRRILQALSSECHELVHRYPDRRFSATYERHLAVWVDREKAVFSAWYELFPRSTATTPGAHGTFRDVVARLPYVAQLGFDVLYLPPIHPIGRINRKGRNNALVAGSEDPGSPWAIGSHEGGHTAIHPELGILEDFRELVERAKSYQIEIAMDIAFQCAPDHPWVAEHPEWFVSRPDGSIQFAENPPKKYEDIYPLNFETEAWESLWAELKQVFEYWMDQGVRIFRVDNPHTKSFPFWEWLIDELHQRDPGVIFLAEAFTRPKRMNRLAKSGFTQSYTYFTWRNQPNELRDYLTELTQGEAREFFRPNFWPNTPDILHEELQQGTRATFLVRLALAATLSSNFGMYGPVYELLLREPRGPGIEEYIDSEKYQIHQWDLEAGHSIAPFIRRLNEIRHDNRALQRNNHLQFHTCDNPAILCYSKHTEDLDNVVLVCANMDYRTTQEGLVEFSPPAVGAGGTLPFVVRDLVSDIAYTWREYWNYIKLDPHRAPVHIFRLEQ